MSTAMLDYEQFSNDLSFLLTSSPPPFIYIQSMQALRTTCAVVQDILRDVSCQRRYEDQPNIHYAVVDAMACFTARLIFERIIHSLAGWEPKWKEGCAVWAMEAQGDVDVRWNENLDTFLHGLRACHKYLSRRFADNENTSGKEKGKQREGIDDQTVDVRLVVVVERAERLKEDYPDLLVPFTRLAELVRLRSFAQDIDKTLTAS